MAIFKWSISLEDCFRSTTSVTVYIYLSAENIVVQFVICLSIDLLRFDLLRRIYGRKESLDQQALLSNLYSGLVFLFLALN